MASYGKADVINNAGFNMTFRVCLQAPPYVAPNGVSYPATTYWHSSNSPDYSSGFSNQITIPNGTNMPTGATMYVEVNADGGSQAVASSQVDAAIGAGMFTWTVTGTTLNVSIHGQ
jgi:hypothetical protein